MGYIVSLIPELPSLWPDADTPISEPTEPCPVHPPCTMTSQTVATSPANQARTTIGVGEEVDIDIHGNPAAIVKVGGGTITANSGNYTTLTAGDDAEDITITATGNGCGCVSSITFHVVRPANWTMKRKSGTNLKHTNGQPDCGWQATLYLHPNNVNFYNVEVREMDSQSVATGSYNPSNHGDWHGSYPPPERVSSWLPMVDHTDADGSVMGGHDNIYSGYPGTNVTGTAPPFVVGSYYWPISWQWKVASLTNVHTFAEVRQEHEIFADGRCESRKGGHTESCLYSDPTSSP